MLLELLLKSFASSAYQSMQCCFRLCNWAILAHHQLEQKLIDKQLLHVHVRGIQAATVTSGGKIAAPIYVRYCWGKI